MDSIHASIRGLERGRLQEAAALAGLVAEAEAKFVKDRDDAAEQAWKKFGYFDERGYLNLLDTFEGVEYLRVRWTALRTTWTRAGTGTPTTWSTR